MPHESSRIRWTTPTPPQSPEPPGAPGGETIATSRPARPQHPATPILDRLGRDLTRLAREGELKPLFGRQNELVQLQRILIRKDKNTPLLVGAPGVGKTALVEGFAQKVIRDETVPELQNLRVVEISPSLLIAGTGVRGTFEAKLQAIIEEARQDARLVLFIDEIHTLIRAGAVEGGSLDAANILKPALARGEIHCIGATTLDEFDRFLRSDAAFERRFEPLILEEPSETEALDILSAARPAYEAHHGVQIRPEAVEAAVRLSCQHMLERRLPDKALDLLDTACTLVRVPGPERQPVPGLPLVVDADTVAQGLAEKLHIPVEKLTQDQRARLAGLEPFLSRRIVGQPVAIARVTAAVRNAFAGLTRTGQPKAVFAFFGSSGIGKTATAKALAEYLFESADALVRLDMSEYKEAHTVSRLFGSPPGYVGYADEGTFASRLRRQPFSVVLLDEVEKAHPEVHDAFLQIFDEGRFTDARGRIVDARQAVFILTSNLYTLREINTVEEYEAHAAAIRQSLGGFFRPEFVNRINELVLFGELKIDDLARIAELEIAGLNELLSRYQVSIQASPASLVWLAQEAYDPSSGARAVIRAVSRLVTEPISSQLVSGSLAGPLALTLAIDGQQLVLKKQAGAAR